MTKSLLSQPSIAQCQALVHWIQERSELLAFDILKFSHKPRTAKSKMLSVNQGLVLSYGRSKPKSFQLSNHWHWGLNCQKFFLGVPNLGAEVWMVESFKLLAFQINVEVWRVESFFISVLQTLRPNYGQPIVWNLSAKVWNANRFFILALQTSGSSFGWSRAWNYQLSKLWHQGLECWEFFSFNTPNFGA